MVTRAGRITLWADPRNSIAAGEDEGGGNLATPGGSDRHESAAPGSPDWLPSFRRIAGDESAAGRFAGAVLVGRGQERVFAEAYGLADREQGIPNELSTRFRHASLSKMFTAVAVGQLVQAGRVD